MLEKFCISVIVPVYNGEPFIEKCLKSILDQNFDKSYEIIMINDGSNDKSVELIKKCNFTNLRLHSLPFISGPAAARNEGIKKASGEYVFFLDCRTELCNLLYQMHHIQIFYFQHFLILIYVF